MEHVLRESENQDESMEKYGKILDHLWELTQAHNLKIENITNELDDMRSMRDNQIKSVVNDFRSFQARERSTGIGLIYTKTGKEISEKVLERLLKNQSHKHTEIAEIRLHFIKIHNNIMELEKEIAKMDQIGENYTLMDYEQLKTDNQNHIDKIEEREEELSKLRVTCSSATQCLAHLREKSAEIELVIDEMTEKLEEVTMDNNDVRERVNALKHERDVLRFNIVKLQEDSGLLTKTKLLIDMEKTLKEINACREQIRELRDGFEKKNAAIENLKKNIEHEQRMIGLRPRIPKESIVKEEPKSKLHSTKPKLVYPMLERFSELL